MSFSRIALLCLLWIHPGITVADTQVADTVAALQQRDAPTAVRSADTVLVGGSAHPETLVLLPPAAFPDLPAAIASELAARGYRIPKGDRGCNVFKAELERKGRFDWAVLALSDSQANLIVFWAGSPQRAEIVTSKPIIQWPDARGTCFYGRGSSSTIRHFRKAWKDDPESGPAPNVAITHDGIEERWAECCSEFLYRHEGKWIRLPGMD